MRRTQTVARPIALLAALALTLPVGAFAAGPVPDIAPPAPSAVATQSADTSATLPAEPATSAPAPASPSIALAPDPVPGAVRLEETDGRLSIVGLWTFAAGTSFSEGAYAYSARSGSSITARFRGPAVTVIGATGPSYGKFEIVVDGVSAGTIDCYAEAYTLATPVWGRADLSDGDHVVTLRVLGTKNALSTGPHVVIDAIDVVSEALDANVADPDILVGGVEESDPRVVYHGLWATLAWAPASGGTLRHATVIGSTVEVHFTGPSVAWIGPRYSQYGIAEVFLDGVSQGLVDQYSPVAVTSDVIWFADGLTDGPHRLTIKVRGERNPASGGTFVMVDRIAAPEVRVPRFEETDARVNRVGAWSAVEDASASGGRYVSSSTAESHIVVRFNGTSVRWLGPTGPGFGRAELHLDGRLVGTVDQYSETPVGLATVWSENGLADGQHALVIRVLGRSRPEATGSAVAFDAAESVRGAYGEPAEWPKRPARAEENDLRLSYAGTWVSAKSPVFSGGGYAYATRAGATITASFDGTSMTVIGATGPAYGQAQVWVDGVNKGIVECYAPDTYAYSAPLLTVTGLAEGTHTVTFRVLGARNPASGGVAVVIDAIDASGGGYHSVFDERSASVARSSGWVLSTSPVMLGGTYAYSRTRGATLRLDYIGTAVKLIAPRGPGYGKVEVLIDGRSAGTADLYAPDFSAQEIVFERSGLTDGVHSVTVRVLGTKNAASSGTTVVMDGFAGTGERITRRGRILAVGRAQLGKQYVFGGSGPTVYDCSGWVSYAYRYGGGITLPHSSRLMWSMCSPQSASWTWLLPGDLVFTDDPSYIHHVGMYVGYGLTINAPGTGKFVEYRAASTYGCFGRIAAKYWPGGYNGL
jgi:hypothetical protein